MEIVGDNSMDWDTIDNLFTKKYKSRIEESTEEIIKIETTIYDIIIEVRKNNLQAARLLDFIRKLFDELASNLNPDEKQLLVPTIRNYLTALDTKNFNYLGELAILNNLMKSQSYTLEVVEFPLANGKTIDFKLKKVATKASILIEVLNLHPKSEKIETEPEKMKAFFTKRLSDKFADKKKNLETDVKFFLIPVMWGTAKDLKIYSNYFKENKMHIENAIEPISYITLSDPQNALYIEHRFKPISGLFKGVQDV